jgi:hypothetical protein
MATQEFTVIDLDGPRLCVLGAVVSGGSVDVVRWRSATRPEAIADTAVAVGAWLGRELREGGFGRSRVVMSVRRNDVVLKQLSIPGGPSVSESSIAGAVRLQMIRQLTMSMEGTAVDYTVMPARPDGQMGIMAGAMPADRAQWCREAAQAAGCKLRRIGLRSSGAAAVLAEVSQRRAGPVLGVCIGDHSTEFVVVEDGQMVMARAAELARPADEELDAYIQKLGVEAKRTWMSYRAAAPGRELELVGVLGDGSLAQRVGAACAGVLGVAVEQVMPPGIVALTAGVPEHDRGMMTALAGLMVESVLETPRLDFANPRKMPDLAARRRQAVLAAAAVLIIVGGGAMVASKKSLGGLQGQLDSLRAEESALRKKVDGFLLTHARVSHIEQWQQARVEWLPHIHRLSDELPSPHDSTADEFGGKMIATTFYDTKGRSSYPGGQWGSRLRSTFDVSGKVSNRTIAADLRERLLHGKIYTVESVGPDTPDRYSVELVTSLPVPTVPQAVAKEGGK